MSEVFCVAIVIGVAIMLSSTEVDGQSTVDDSASCESSSFADAVSIIREDLKDVKNACASKEQQVLPTMATTDGTLQPDAQSTVDVNASCESSRLDEALMNLIRDDLKDVKFIKEELGELKLIREDLKDVKNHLSLNQQQQSNESCISKEDLKAVLASLQKPSDAGDTSSLCEYSIHPRLFISSHK